MRCGSRCRDAQAFTAPARTGPPRHQSQLAADGDAGSAEGELRHLLFAPRPSDPDRLKKYGMILADNGSATVYLGRARPRWNDNEMNALKTITGSNFEVVQMGPVYTNADFPTGAPPVIDSFTANHKAILAGQLVTLSGPPPIKYNMVAPQSGRCAATA